MADSNQFSKSNYTQGYSKATLSSHASRTIHSDAAFLLPHIKPTDSILDVGCGPGTITAGFATLVPHGSVVGVDISADVLATAQDYITQLRTKGALSQSHNNNPSFQQADLLSATGLPFPDASFDVVYSSQLFPHLPGEASQVAALTEMHRVLKPGGLLATRDAVSLHFFPKTHDLDRLWAGNMARALGGGGMPGGKMPSLFRRTGLADITTGAGTTVHSNRAERNALVEGHLGRLTVGDPYRESWLSVGITEEEIDETRVQLQKWRDDDDAWYCALQAEMLGRKPGN